MRHILHAGRAVAGAPDVEQAARVRSAHRVDGAVLVERRCDRRSGSHPPARAAGGQVLGLPAAALRPSKQDDRTSAGTADHVELSGL